MRINRRDFLARTAAASGSVAAFPFVRGTRLQTFRTALIGSGWWGTNILRCAIQSGRCSVAALCDVDRRQLETARAEVASLTADQPRLYTDYRELLSKEKPDIAIVATPDHWHALTAIAAIGSGAHLYLEKPVGHTILEGRAMVNAARRHDRIVQVGTHRRVSPHNVSGIQFLRSGKAGKIGMVRAFVHYPGDEGEPTPNAEVPQGLDWDFWCGPAPLRPFNPRIHPRGFRQFLDYANGQLGDWGIHWMDQILWWTDEKFPGRVSSTGGRMIKRDNTDAPDTQVVTYEFESFVVNWEHRLYAGNDSEKHQVGCYFYGTKGVFHMGWLDGWTFYPTAKGEQPIQQEPSLHKPDDQNIPELWADFIDAVDKNRRPVCDIEIGHRSTNMSLLGMIALKTGRTIRWNGTTETIIDDTEANALLRRDYRAPWVYPEA